MKSLRCLMAIWSFVFALPVWAGQGGGNGAGHGGHPAELRRQAEERIRVTREVRDALRSAREDFLGWAAQVLVAEHGTERGISGTEIVRLLDSVLGGKIVIDATNEALEIRLVRKLAINYPRAGLIRVNIPLWDEYKKNFALAKAILIHEVVPFRRSFYNRLEIDQYQHSAVYYLAAVERSSDLASLMRGPTQYRGGTERPGLYTVYSEYFDRDPQGLRADQVEERCNAVAARINHFYPGRFRHLFCRPLQKLWQEILVSQPRRNAILTELVDREAYGFLVIGMQINERTRMRVVATTEAPALKGGRPLRFDDRYSALRDCNDFLANQRSVDQLPPWAYCNDVRERDGVKFYYEIVAPDFGLDF